MSSSWYGSVAHWLHGSRRYGWALGVSALLAACSDPASSIPDELSELDLSASADVRLRDAGLTDSGRADSGRPDAGFTDAGFTDAGRDGPGHPEDFSGGAKRLRVMAANTSTGNNQSYDPGEGLRIFQGLHADVVLIQEFNYGDNSDSAIRGFVTTAFGASFSYFRETGAQIPNAVASRYPILASGSWTDPKVSNRGFAWARIDVPGPKDLWAVSVHLLTSSAANRDAEAQALVDDITKNVPAGDYVVIGGDLNSGTRTEACLTTFSSVVSVASPYPVDNLGNDNTSGARSKPHDWVMPSPNLRSLETGVVIGAHSFPSGLVVDSRVYTPLADITPVLVNDSGAATMQHMAVVQDFLIP